MSCICTHVPELALAVRCTIPMEASALLPLCSGVIAAAKPPGQMAGCGNSQASGGNRRRGEEVTRPTSRAFLPFDCVGSLFSLAWSSALPPSSHNLYQHRPKQRRTRGAVCRDEDTAESMGAICSSTNGAVSSPVKNAGNDDKVGNGAVLDEHATACHGNATGEPHK